KGSVAQAVAKGKQRLASKVAVGAAFHAVVVEGGQLGFRLVERHRQAAGGVVVAKEYIGQRRAGGLAPIPTVEDGRQVGSFPRRGQGAARHQGQHYGLA
nr:hypothetical protein [Tanacetum cinerariifolium]